MIVLRLLAALVVVAFALVLMYLWKRDRRYLRWAWRTFLAALFGALALMVFYFVERLLFSV